MAHTMVCSQACRTRAPRVIPLPCDRILPTRNARGCSDSDKPTSTSYVTGSLRALQVSSRGFQSGRLARPTFLGEVALRLKLDPRVVAVTPEECIAFVCGRHVSVVLLMCSRWKPRTTSWLRSYPKSGDLQPLASLTSTLPLDHFWG